MPDSQVLVRNRITTPAQWVATRFRKHYVEWRERRVAAILDHYGDRFFDGCRLLELGCGYGDIGGAFAQLGAQVTACDARQEHLDVAASRWPGIEFVQVDLNQEWPFGRFDLILHLGLLYHLEPTHRSLHWSCQSTDHLVIETEVCDSSAPDVVLTTPEDGYDQAVDGVGCRPSAERIEGILEADGFTFERITDDRCNAGMHVYDWTVRETGTFTHGQRRFWFARR